VATYRVLVVTPNTGVARFLLSKSLKFRQIGSRRAFDIIPDSGHTYLKREQPDLGRCSVFGPATSWDTYYNGTQFGSYLLSTPKREFLSIIELEAERGLAVGAIRLIGIIETAEGLSAVNEIARATPRLLALIVGSEDLAASLGGQPTPDAMYVPNLLTLTAARAAGVLPLGYAGSISVYKDTELYREWISRAAALGFEGVFCIHPNQVAICNEIFMLSTEEIAKARELIGAYEKHVAEELGVFAFEGRMVDAPVVDRSRKILAKVIS